MSPPRKNREQRQTDMTKVIKELEEEDLVAVASIHMQAFPNSALTKLGFEPVRRYYEWQMIGPHETLIIGAFNEGKMVGFCVGGIFRGALGGYLDKNRNFLIRKIVTHPWLVFNSIFRDRARFAIWRTLRKVSPFSKETSALEKPQGRSKSFGILSIAVAPQHQGTGTAKLLMEYSEHVALERGFAQMGLSVHPSNGRAIRFYEKMGWQKDEIDGKWSGHMTKFLENFQKGTPMKQS